MQSARVDINMMPGAVAGGRGGEDGLWKTVQLGLIRYKTIRRLILSSRQGATPNGQDLLTVDV
jgi:hypothetical protein